MTAPESPTTLQPEVLIVGAGPAGMTMALALSKCGIHSLLIDKRDGISPEPRAHALNCRTLEILAALDVDIDQLRRVGTPDHESCWVRWVDTLNGGEYGKLPYERMVESDPVPSSQPLFNITQPATETVLQQQVIGDPNIQLERSWAWQSCEQDDAAVHSRITGGNGELVTVTSRYLIAADGAGSPIRNSQNIAMEGVGVLQNFKNVHFRADLRSLVADKPAILYWVMEQACAGTLIAYDIADNWVFMYPYDANQTDPASLTDAVCEGLVRSAIGDPALDIEILGIGDWVMSSEIATHYRSQRVFLMGDAAHRFPPSGGLGLNTGVGDAHNLGWKLAAVLSGWASDSLLESYQTERHQVAQQNADFSLENAGKMLDVFVAAGTFAAPGEQLSLASLLADSTQWGVLQDSIEQQRPHFDGLALHIGAHYGSSTAPDTLADCTQPIEVGARFPHSWLRVDNREVSSQDLLCVSAFTLFLGEGVELATLSIEAPCRVCRQGVEFHAEGLTPGQIGLDQYAAVLVRPDGHIAGLFDSPEQLHSAVQTSLAVALAA